MSDFKEPPVIVLPTMDDVRWAIETPDWFKCVTGIDRYRVKSLWLVSLIDEIVASGKYPYNADVKRLAERRLGYPERSDRHYGTEGDSLSTLIYNAQCYRRDADYRARGYVPLTDALIAKAGDGARFETAGGERLTVRKVGGNLYAFKPRKRRFRVMVYGQPVKLVKSGKPLTAEELLVA